MLNMVLYMPMFVVTEFIHGFHKTICGTIKSVKKLYVLLFKKFLLRRSRCSGLRRDNKRSVFVEKKLLLLFLQRSLNITIPTNTPVLLIKAIKNC